MVNLIDCGVRDVIFDSDMPFGFAGTITEVEADHVIVTDSGGLRIRYTVDNLALPGVTLRKAVSR